MKNKLLIAISALLLLAIMLPAGAAISVDFESPVYTTGNLIGQDGWSSSAGGNFTVSATNPISGAQSITGIGTGAATANKSITLYDQTSISFLTRLNGSGTFASIYLFSDNTAIAWFSPNAWSDNVRFWHSSLGSAEDPGISISNSTDVYKTQWNLDFTTPGASFMTIVLTDITNPEVVWTSNIIAIPDNIKAQTNYIGFACWSGSVTFDNINVCQTPTNVVPEPGSIFALCSGLVGLAGFAIRRK